MEITVKMIGSTLGKPKKRNSKLKKFASIPFLLTGVVLWLFLVGFATRTRLMALVT